MPFDIEEDASQMAHENNGSIYAYDTYGWIGRMGDADQHTGIFFDPVPDVGQGDTIDDAQIRFCNVWGSAGPVIVGNLYGDDVDDTDAFDDPGDLPSGITKTTAKTQVQQVDGPADDETLDITSIVQEIVNRGGWNAGQAMRFVALANTGINNYEAIAPLHSRTWQPTWTPQPSILEIDYTAGGASDVPSRHRRASPTYPLTM